MIDDAVLERLVREAADSIEVPAGAAEQIVAARNADAPPARLRRAHRPPQSAKPGPVLTLAGALAALVGLIVGVAAVFGSGGGGLQGPSAPNAASRPSPPTTVYPDAAPTAGVAGSEIQSRAEAVPGAAPPGASRTLPAEVIKTGSVDLLVAHDALQLVVTGLARIATGDGGFVAASTARGDVTLRVPAARFETTVDQVLKLGTPISVTTSARDASSQYVDLKARMQVLLVARALYEQILRRAQTTDDLLGVKSQIAVLQGQIEQLQGQLQVWDDQIIYSTLSVHVTERAAS
jgi:hypothetical protein